MDRRSASSFPARVKRVVSPPDPVEGEVVDVDTGYERSVVVTVERNGETHYETYELANVESSQPSP